MILTEVRVSVWSLIIVLLSWDTLSPRPWRMLELFHYITSLPTQNQEKREERKKESLNPRRGICLGYKLQTAFDLPSGLICSFLNLFLPSC